MDYREFSLGLSALALALEQVSKSKPGACVVLGWHDGSRERASRVYSASGGRLMVDREFARHVKGLSAHLHEEEQARRRSGFGRFDAVRSEVARMVGGAAIITKGTPMAERVKEYVDSAVLQLDRLASDDLEEIDPESLAGSPIEAVALGWSQATEIYEEQNNNAESSTEANESDHSGSLQSSIEQAINKMLDGTTSTSATENLDDAVVRIGDAEYRIGDIDFSGLNDAQLHALHDRIHLASVVNDEDVHAESERRQQQTDTTSENGSMTSSVVFDYTQPGNGKEDQSLAKGNPYHDGQGQFTFSPANVLADRFGIDAAGISAETQLDSLSVPRDQLLEAIMSHYGVTLGSTEGIKTIGDLVARLETARAANSASG